jgi:hypothetical protein
MAFLLRDFSVSGERECRRFCGIGKPDNDGCAAASHGSLIGCVKDCLDGRAQRLQPANALAANVVHRRFADPKINRGPAREAGGGRVETSHRTYGDANPRIT